MILKPRATNNVSASIFSSALIAIISNSLLRFALSIFWAQNLKNGPTIIFAKDNSIIFMLVLIAILHTQLMKKRVSSHFSCVPTTEVFLREDPRNSDRAIAININDDRGQPAGLKIILIVFKPARQPSEQIRRILDVNADDLTKRQHPRLWLALESRTHDFFPFCTNSTTTINNLLVIS